MSVICALHDATTNETWLGSDTMGRSGGVQLSGRHKWYVSGEWAIGCVGDLRAGNVVEKNLECLVDDLPGAYELALRIRQVLAEDGFERSKESASTLDYSQGILLAHTSCIWDVGSDFSIQEVPSNMLWSDGSGRAFAIGAGLALSNASPEDRIRTALVAACEFDADCGGEFWVSALGRPSDASKISESRAA